jgi:hydroxymethylglutaryl-CoA reductase (NADPH)
VKSRRAARALPHWPRANRSDAIVQRQTVLRALKHWEAAHHHVLSWPVPAEMLSSFLECLTGHMVVPVGVIGPLTLNIGDYGLDNVGSVQEAGRIDDQVYVPLAHTEGGLSASIQRGVSAVALERGCARTF